LRDGPCTISDLVAILDIGQSTVSRHVAVLRERGIVRVAREGPSVVCHLADRRVLDALDQLRGVMRDHIRHESELFAPVGAGS
jgi:ArsR family transcriptional regulator